MNPSPGPKQSHNVRLERNTPINREIFSLEFLWTGPIPHAGQFFMIRPRRGSVLLGRPISMAGWDVASHTIRFLIARRGWGTEELADLHPGEEAELTGPLGNTWPLKKGNSHSFALVGGGIGVAPLEALFHEMPDLAFDFYAGFRTSFKTTGEREAILGPALSGRGKLVIATEDGTEGLQGRIPEFFDPAPYTAVYACGPEPMLKAVAALCKTTGTSCFVSLERRMACGVGACLGCAVTTTGGNKHCCTDGPVFNAGEIVFCDCP